MRSRASQLLIATSARAKEIYARSARSQQFRRSLEEANEYLPVAGTDGPHHPELERIFRPPQERKKGGVCAESRNEGDNTEPLTAIEAQRSTAASLHLESTTELPADSSASSLTELGL